MGGARVGHGASGGVGRDGGVATGEESMEGRQHVNSRFRKGAGDGGERRGEFGYRREGFDVVFGVN